MYLLGKHFPRASPPEQEQQLHVKQENIGLDQEIPETLFPETPEEMTPEDEQLLGKQHEQLQKLLHLCKEMKGTAVPVLPAVVTVFDNGASARAKRDLERAFDAWCEGMQISKYEKTASKANGGHFGGVSQEIAEEVPLKPKTGFKIQV